MNEEMEIDQPKGKENDQQETDKEMNKDGEDQPNDDPAIQNQIDPLVIIIIIIDKIKQVLTNTTGFFLKIKIKIFFG